MNENTWSSGQFIGERSVEFVDKNRKIDRIAALALAIGALAPRILDGRGGQGSAIHECSSLVELLSEELAS